MPVSPEIEAIWVLYNEDLEGIVYTMYADVIAYVTTGMGNLIHPMAAAMSLPWLHPSMRPATQAEIANEWGRVWNGCCKPSQAHQHIPAKDCPLKQAGKVCHAHDGWRSTAGPGALWLSRAAVEGLILSKLRSNHGVLAGYFPELDGWNLNATTAAHSLAWAVGPHWPTKFPKCKAACLAQDWARYDADGKLVGGAAKEGRIAPAHGTVITRNDRQRVLFENAGRGVAAIEWRRVVEAGHAGPKGPAHVAEYPTRDTVKDV